MAVDATSIFGSGSAVSIFAAGVSGGASDAQIAAQQVVNATQQEINRIRGYKVQLTPSEQRRLDEIQVEIEKITQKTINGTARPDELDDREQLFLEADTIIGKPSAGVEIDDTLEELRDKVDEVFAPRLTPPQQDRLDTLNTLLETFQDKLDDDPTNVNTIRQLQNINRQIANIDVPRKITELSVTEKLEYDALVEETNQHAGAKLLLNSQESTRVQFLQETIDKMAGLLPADPGGQPTAAAVARAYTRLA